MVKSALQGHALAQLDLGRLYASGGDVSRDIRQARYWLNLAATQEAGSASTSAITMLNELNQGESENDKLAYAR